MGSGGRKKRSKDEEVKYVSEVLLRYSSLLFSLGMAYDLVRYILSDNIVLLGINVVSLIIFGVSYLLYVRRTIEYRRALFMQLFVISCNLCISTIYEGYLNNESAEVTIILNMCIYIIPVLLSALTGNKMLPVVFTAGAVSSYCISAYLMGDVTMLINLPVLALTIIGAPIALVRVVEVTKQIERERLQVVQEQQKLFNALNIAQEQVQILTEDGVDNENVVKLLDKLDDQVRDNIVSRVKKVINTEERIINALKESYPNLTASEIEVCCLIVEGKSVSEICEIRHVSVSTVTSIRSRLRTKLGVAKGESLKTFLTSIVNRSWE